MEIRGYGVVLVVRGYAEVVHGNEAEVRGYGEELQRDCEAGYDCVVGYGYVEGYDYVEVCGCVDHMDLEVDHVDVRKEGRVDVLEVDHVDRREGHVEVDHADVQREGHAVVDHVDVRREARVRGEDLVPAAVAC